MGIYFKGTGELSAIFEGDKQTKKMLGNMEHRKTKILVWGKGELVSKIVSGSVYPSPPFEGLDG